MLRYLSLYEDIGGKIMVVLKAIGNFFARIGRWIRDTAWVQPLLIVGGIFAIIFSIPSITSWVQGWFKTGDAAVSFYKNKNNGYKRLDNKGEDGVGSDADELLSFIFSEDGEKTEEQYKKFGEKFFLTFVQEDCSECAGNYKAWKTAKDSWGKEAGFRRVKQGDTVLYEANKSDFKMYTIFVDQTNDNDENYFTLLHDKIYSAQFCDLSTLENPYKENSNKSYDGIASSQDDDLSGGSVFTTPTTFLFDREFAESNFRAKGYNCGNDRILDFKISEIIFGIDEKSSQSSGTSLAKARTLWDCWNHIGQFCNYSSDQTEFVSE